MTTGQGATNNAAGDPAAGAGQNPAGAAAHPAGQTNTPQGGDNAELERLRRIEQQYKGAQPLIDAAIKAGLKTPEDVARVNGIAAKVGGLGVDLDQLTVALQGKTNPNRPDDGGDGTLTLEDVQKLVQSTVGETYARNQHDTATQAEKRLLAGAINGLAGKDASPQVKTAIAGIVQQLVYDQSELYPKGHPLEGEVVPLTEAQIAEIRKEAEEVWSGVRNPSLSTLAAGASTARPVAGNPGGQGPSGQDKKNDVPAYKRPREERLARARQIAQHFQAAGARAPISQA